MEHNLTPVTKTKSLGFKIAISFFTLIVVYSIVLILSTKKLNEDKIVFDDIVNFTMPKIINTNNHYGEIKELSFLTQKLNSSKNQAIRRLIYEETIKKVISIQEMSKKLNIQRDDLDKRLFLIKNELIQLNSLINKNLSIKNTINENIQKLNELNYNIILLSAKERKNNNTLTNHKLKLQKIISLTYQSLNLTKLNELRSNIKKIKEERKRLNKTIKSQYHKKLIHNIDEIILDENGLIPLKLQYIILSGRVEGNSNFLNTLIIDLASEIEYTSYQSIKQLISKAHLSSQKVQEQTNYVFLIYFLSFFLFLIILFYINKTVVIRLIKINKDINSKINGKNLEIGDNYEDEISQILDSFNFYSNKIEEQKQKLEKLAITDKLTNIYNRAKMDTVILEEIDRSKRFNHLFSLAMIDIDYFKNVNDQYGHQVGDIVLVEIAKILKQNVRNTDYIGRWGGEEFIIICPETKLDGLLKLTNNIRTKIENFNFPTVKEKTASFGLAQYEKEDTIESLIKKADKALYKAKKLGRNRIEY